MNLKITEIKIRVAAFVNYVKSQLNGLLLLLQKRGNRNSLQVW